MKNCAVFFAFLCLEVFAEGLGADCVTYGSVLKLLNTNYKVRLHSHDVKYGTGSGQQSVTATQQTEDVNSHWVVKAPTKKYYTRGDPVQCGDVIRLQHLITHKNLHSHRFSSPLSENQEVSAYGTDGEGDTGDHWTVVCQGEYWERNESIMLRHVDTEVYLSVSGEIYGRPINGQMEVVGSTRIRNSVHWKAAEGMFIFPNEFNLNENLVHAHTEL